MTTTVSVVIPCYNIGAFLLEAVESVLGQQPHDNGTLPETELLIVDDSSTDRQTLVVLESLGRRSPRIRVLRNTRAKGVSAARNTGIAEAHGEWIAFLDGDDLWLPEALSRRYRVAIEHPEARWIAGDFHFLNPDGSLLPSGSGDVGCPRGQILHRALETGKTLRLKRPVDEFLRVYLIHTSTVMVSRSLLRAVGGFNESLERAEDYDLWLRLALVADLFFVPDPVARYRQRPGSLTAAEEPPSRHEIAVFSHFVSDERYRAHRTLLHERMTTFHLNNCRYHRSKGQQREAMRSALAALRWQPAHTSAWRQFVAAALGR